MSWCTPIATGSIVYGVVWTRRVPSYVIAAPGGSDATRIEPCVGAVSRSERMMKNVTPAASETAATAATTTLIQRPPLATLYCDGSSSTSNSRICPVSDIGCAAPGGGKPYSAPGETAAGGPCGWPGIGAVAYGFGA